jgi:hypothetical protein
MLLHCYYLAEPLSRSDLDRVGKTVAYIEFMEASDLMLEQVEVPSIWLARRPGEYNESEDIKRHMRLVRRNLRNAGIQQDVGRQLGWVMPREDAYWATVFQIAIFEETRFYPSSVQHWSVNDGKVVRGSLRVIDGHGMMGGKG